MSATRDAATDAKAAPNVAQDNDVITDEVRRFSVEELINRTRLLEAEIGIMKREKQNIIHERRAQEEKIKENVQKIKVSSCRC